MRAIAPVVAMLALAAADLLAAQDLRPAPAARVMVTATVVPVATALQSARLIRITLDQPMPSGHSTRRDNLSWVTVDRTPGQPRRVTVNYLVN